MGRFYIYLPMFSSFSIMNTYYLYYPEILLFFVLFGQTISEGIVFFPSTMLDPSE